MNQPCRPRPFTAVSWWMKALLAAGVPGGAPLLAGCSPDTSYVYIDVAVTIDRQTIPPARLSLVTGCEFEVRGIERLVGNDLGCREGATPYDLGTFQWATARGAGFLQFFVKLLDPNRAPLGEGQSAEVPLSPGAHLQASVTVVAVP